MSEGGRRGGEWEIEEEKSRALNLSKTAKADNLGTMFNYCLHRTLTLLNTYVL